MNNCSSAPPRVMVTLSKSTDFKVTPGSISSPTAMLRCWPSEPAMMAEPRPEAWSCRIPNNLRFSEVTVTGPVAPLSRKKGSKLPRTSVEPERSVPASRQPPRGPTGVSAVQISRAHCRAMRARRPSSSSVQPLTPRARPISRRLSKAKRIYPRPLPREPTRGRFSTVVTMFWRLPSPGFASRANFQLFRRRASGLWIIRAPPCAARLLPADDDPDRPGGERHQCAERQPVGGRDLPSPKPLREQGRNAEQPGSDQHERQLSPAQPGADRGEQFGVAAPQPLAPAQRPID